MKPDIENNNNNNNRSDDIAVDVADVVKPSQSFQLSSQTSKGFTSQTSTLLSETFVLTDNDVLCGRGSKCFNHPGNQKFRKLVESHLHKYTNTMCKYDKSAIICEVVNEVRVTSPNGGFIKYDADANRYYEVGDFLAREKTSQAFRDAIQDKYKSSNSTKRKKRILESQNKLNVSNSNLNNLNSSFHNINSSSYHDTNKNLNSSFHNRNTLNASSCHSHDGFWRNFSNHGGEESLNNSFHFDVDGNLNNNTSTHDPYQNLHNAEDILHGTTSTSTSTGKQIDGIGIGIGLHHLHSSLPNLMAGFRSSDNVIGNGGYGVGYTRFNENNNSNSNSNSNFITGNGGVGGVGSVNDLNNSTSSMSRRTQSFVQNGNSNNGRNSSLANIRGNIYNGSVADNITSINQGRYNSNNVMDAMHNSTSALYGGMGNSYNNVQNNRLLTAILTNNNINNNNIITVNGMANQQQKHLQHRQQETYGEEATLPTEPMSDNSSVASFDQDDYQPIQQVQQEQVRSMVGATVPGRTDNNIDIQSSWGNSNNNSNNSNNNNNGNSGPRQVKRRNSMFGSGYGNGNFSTLAMCIEEKGGDGSYASPQHRSGRFLACGKQNELLGRIAPDRSNNTSMSCTSKNSSRDNNNNTTRQLSTSELLGVLPIENAGDTLQTSFRDEQDGLGSISRFLNNHGQQQQQDQQQQQQLGISAWANQSCPSFGHRNNNNNTLIQESNTLAPLEHYFSNDDWEAITSPSCFASPVFGSASGSSKQRISRTVTDHIRSDMLIDNIHEANDSNNNNNNNSLKNAIDMEPIPLHPLNDRREEGGGITDLSASDFQSDFLLSSMESMPMEGSSQNFGILLDNQMKIGKI